jgi:hypothetical protein
MSDLRFAAEIEPHSGSYQANRTVQFLEKPIFELTAAISVSHDGCDGRRPGATVPAIPQVTGHFDLSLAALHAGRKTAHDMPASSCRTVLGTCAARVIP